MMLSTVVPKLVSFRVSLAFERSGESFQKQLLFGLNSKKIPNLKAGL
jgi:hypothetical protein